MEGKTGLSLELGNMLSEIIKNRRTVAPEQFSGERLSDELVWKLLENANWAPTHGRTEPWRFAVFVDQAKERLAQTIADIYKSTSSQEEYNAGKMAKIKERIVLSSHVVAVWMKRDSTRKIPKMEEIEACACAVQNMWISATAYGLGMFWSSGAWLYTAEVKKLFGLGEEDEFLGLLFLGELASEPREGTRGPVQAKVLWFSE